MEIEEKEKLKVDSLDKAKPSILQIVCDTVWLAVTTAVLLGVYIATFLSSDSIFGVQNTTGEVSDSYYTQVCPRCPFVDVKKPQFICFCFFALNALMPTSSILRTNNFS